MADSSTNRIILLVEDDENDAFFIQWAFHRVGIHLVYHAATAQQAVDYLAGKGDFGNRHQLGMPEAFVPEELPHMRPVLLFAVRVVVLAIGPAARPGQLYRSAGQVAVQRPVEEFPAVVGVESPSSHKASGFEKEEKRGAGKRGAGKKERGGHDHHH
jgi:hypothetical protein